MYRNEQKKAVSWMIASLILLVMVLVPGVAGAREGSTEIVIFHTNDMHARMVVDDDNGTIGLASMAAAVKAVRSHFPSTLWLDAGDTLHGLPRINISKGDNAVALLNKACVDVTVPGNHDFNYGSDRLEELASKLDCMVLSANTVRKDKKGERLFDAYTILEMENGIRVGIFGLSTPETAFKTNPVNVTKVEFLDPVKSAKEMVKKLRPDCDVLVAVVHMGLDGSSVFTSERIAREVKGIDVMIDGHSHTELPNGLVVGKTLIAQTGYHGKNLGCVTLKLQGNKIVEKNARLLNSEEVKVLAPIPDAAIEQLVANIDAHNKALFSEVIAKSDRELSGERALVRTQETEIGNLCADAFRWRTGADIAVINGGGIRHNLPAGDFTRGDAVAIFPFGNTLRMAEIQGKAIREMLEHSVFSYPAAFGGFMHVSGITFSFDPAKPVGQRVGDIFIGGKLLDEKRIYTMTSNDFVIAGGDDYSMLGNLHIVGEFDTCEEALADYLNTVGMDGIEIGRITVIGKSGAAADEGEYAEAA